MELIIAGIVVWLIVAGFRYGWRKTMRNVGKGFDTINNGMEVVYRASCEADEASEQWMRDREAERDRRRAEAGGEKKL